MNVQEVFEILKAHDPWCLCRGICCGTCEDRPCNSQTGEEEK